MNRKLDRKIPIVVVSVFLAVGLSCLVAAAATYLATNRFVARAEQTTGTVIELEEHTSTTRDADGHTRRQTTWAPVVRFTTDDGRAIEFRSNVRTSPATHDVGDTVTVAYDPDNPEDAKIVGFVDLYLMPLILGGIGVIFTTVGGIILLVRMRRRRQRAWLREQGQPVEAEVVAVRLNTHYRVNGRHPYVVDAVWRDPRSGAAHSLRSDRLWGDPRPGVDVGHRVQARIDPDRPTRHLMEVADPGESKW